MPPPPSDCDALRAMRRVLELRAKLNDAIRRFFRDRGFLEVETPVLLPANAPEAHIDAIPAGTGWIRTSPELAMKRLLAAGQTRIFQLGPVAREGEHGRWHHPEFCLLEWYRAEAGYLDMLADTKALLSFLAVELRGQTDFTWQGKPLSLAQELWEKHAVSQAFIEHAGWDPALAFDPDRFDLDLVTRVEPALPADRPVILIDYPAPCAALARRKPDDPARAERWELYLAGIELANAYSELTDPGEQRARFEAANAARVRRGGRPCPLDETFLAALAHMPPSGGIALGVDRLLMILADVDSLDGVLPFRFG
ncbi:MAG TPA: EF-P lysine aminoacylase EpmA [Kiritimatiellia bacterium]|nr:EF-P lysine aminoacylase EpmA [Kiritimatiellia bacterium]HPC19381.1 EF-P lysine aminoacylase EpmA [Kiritimatiellia bacterium]HQN80272.1 EF-P lysine aminoacylase EpmA [Kiritimatiellia bacterium]